MCSFFSHTECCLGWLRDQAEALKELCPVLKSVCACIWGDEGWVFLDMHEHACVCVHMYVLYVFVHVYMCIYVYVCAQVSLCLCIYMCLCMYLCVHIDANMCCVCAYM